MQVIICLFFTALSGDNSRRILCACANGLTRGSNDRGFFIESNDDACGSGFRVADLGFHNIVCLILVDGWRLCAASLISELPRSCPSMPELRIKTSQRNDRRAYAVMGIVRFFPGGTDMNGSGL